MEIYLRHSVAIFIGCSIIGLTSIDMVIALIQNHPPTEYIIEQWNLSRFISLIIATIIFSLMFRRKYENPKNTNG